jgi:hypothetical protein
LPTASALNHPHGVEHHPALAGDWTMVMVIRFVAGSIRLQAVEAL